MLQCGLPRKHHELNALPRSMKIPQKCIASCGPGTQCGVIVMDDCDRNDRAGARKRSGRRTQWSLARYRRRAHSARLAKSNDAPVRPVRRPPETSGGAVFRDTDGSIREDHHEQA
jgi:hypothetical protein